ncbi:glycerol-3-phosphate acyltransferase, partial [Candidatus Bipolaricaulota bacterium]|nr:glycerol-3-phosphate acyltransferase [Candidatus Bipolaricaulota bacterium]
MLSVCGMILLGYLLGSISSAWIIGRMKKIDLRAVGSENLGAANVFREAGKSWGIITGLFDVGKGFLPVFLAGGVLGLAPWALVLVG